MKYGVEALGSKYLAHACRIADGPDRPNWSDIALAAEYFDQAHLIRDFHQFTGQTPMAVFSNTRSRRPA